MASAIPVIAQNDLRTISFWPTPYAQYNNFMTSGAVIAGQPVHTLLARFAGQVGIGIAPGTVITGGQLVVNGSAQAGGNVAVPDPNPSRLIVSGAAAGIMMDSRLAPTSGQRWVMYAGRIPGPPTANDTFNYWNPSTAGGVPIFVVREDGFHACEYRRYNFAAGNPPTFCPANRPFAIFSTYRTSGGCGGFGGGCSMNRVWLGAFLPAARPQASIPWAPWSHPAAQGRCECMLCCTMPLESVNSLGFAPQ